MRYLSIVFLFVSAQTLGQDSDYRAYYTKAIEAYKAKAYPEFYKNIKEANTLHPWHQGILYQLGMAAALTGHKSEAIDNLQKALAIDNRFRVAGLADFNSIKDLPEFKKLIALQKESEKPQIHSDTAFTIKDRSLHCEGIEYDASTTTFYLGSIHKRKIITVKNGVAADFCPAGFEGMTSVFGLKIDPARKILWVCSSPMPEMENFDSTARSGVFKFDLVSGKLLEKFIRPKFQRDGVFGDLIISRKGDVFVSDGQTNTLFKVNEKNHQLEPWFTSGEFWNMQGMAFSENQNSIFLSDYVKGIYKIDTKTKALTGVSCSLPVSLKGVDGLYYYKNSLIAVQNGVNPLRVTRFFLDKDQTKIVGSEIIDSGHPAFNEPTLGVIDGDVFYYIANSQWEGYDPQHHILPDGKLQDIVILKAKLKP